MAEHSKIEWTDTTWNPTRGCSKVSAGCASCYAMRQAHRFSGPGQPYEGLTHIVPGKGAQWTGKVTLAHDALGKPLRWRKPRRVFVDSMSDLFHPDVPFEFVARVFDVMADERAERHTFQVLTKRPERMAEFLDEWMPEHWPGDSPASATMEVRGHIPNVWLGVSVENQAAADERIPHLLRCPAAVRFLSCEPLLGPVELTYSRVCGRMGWGPPSHPVRGEDQAERLRREVSWLLGPPSENLRRINWVIAGGESGPGARPCDVAWLRSLRDQCAAAKVPFFLKQLGADPWSESRYCTDCDDDNAPCYSARPCSCSCHGQMRLRDRKGGDMAEWPEDLRVREFPRATMEGTDG